MPAPASRLTAAVAALVLPLVLLFGGGAAAQSGPADQERWDTVKGIYFPDRTIEDGSAFITLEAPYRAQDAALVPVTVTATVPADADWTIKTLSLVIDANPVPMAGKFQLFDDQKKVSLSTRVRVNEYTLIHAVAETSDGRLLSAERYVKAAGGCSAPAMKDPQQAMARVGKMKLNLPQTVALGQPVTAQVLIGHPNHSGMQFDQISRTYIPPYYVRTIKVSYDGQPVLAVDTDISLSEDPSLHFSFTPKAAGALSVEVTDSKDQTYSASWPVTPQPAS